MTMTDMVLCVVHSIYTYQYYVIVKRQNK